MENEFKLSRFTSELMKLGERTPHEKLFEGGIDDLLDLIAMQQEVYKQNDKEAAFDRAMDGI